MPEVSQAQKGERPISNERPRRFSYIPKPLLHTALALGITTLTGCEVFSPTWEETPPNVDNTAVTTPAPIPPESTPQLQEREDPLQEEIENRFGVKLLTLKDQFRAKGKPLDLKHTNEWVLASPDKWDRPRLQMLDRFLNGLPPRLYKLGEGEYQLRIVLAMKNQLLEHKDGYLEVLLNYQQFDPSDETLAFKIYTHENTHGLNRVNSYVWHDNIKSILGYEDFPAFSYPIFEKAVGIISQIKKSDLPEEEKKKKIADYTEIAYGFGFPGIKDPDELISILTGFYLKGKEEFTSGPLSDFFDPEAIEKLYAFLKDNVFDGREYLDMTLHTS